MKTIEDQISTLIRTSRLSRIADELLALLRPSIRIQRHKVDESSLALGASKLGGLPDLPPEMEWPTNEDRPLALLAQIRLADVAPYDRNQELPQTGILYFFLDPSPEAYPYLYEEDRRVIYYDGDLSQLRRRSAPAAEEDLELCNPSALTFSSQLMLPPLQSEETKHLGLSYLYARTSPQRQDSEVYVQLKEQLEKLSSSAEFAEQGEDPSADAGPLHQLLGYSCPIQDPVEGYGWRLLLQIDTDPYDIQWGDMGILYFLITQEALAARDFSQVEATSQCG